MFLTEASAKRPIATLMAVLAITMGGLIGLFTLPVDKMPNSEPPEISVFVGVRGGMPSEEIERLITAPIEEAVASMAGLKELMSVSRKDRSELYLYFENPDQVKRATLEVSERLAKIKGKLPKEIEKPIVARYKEGDHPVVILNATSSTKTPEFIRGLLERDLKPKLSRLTGVANVEIYGGRQRKILVEFEKVKLEMHRLPILEVIRQLGANNITLSSGEQFSQRDTWSIQVVGDFRSIDEMKELGVDVTKEGSRLRLKDIANIRDYFLEADSHSRINGQDSVTIQVQKESGANTIEVAQEVIKAANEYQKTLPPDVGIGVGLNQSVAIKQAISDVKEALTEGAFLTAFILWFFLRKTKQIAVIVLSIPVAVLGTFFVMTLHALIMGKLGNPPMFTINIMSLLGIALGIGRMVDDSIVVFENILHRYEEAAKKGEKNIDRVQLVVQATGEMALAVASSTLILVVIFLPIVLFSEDIRKKFSDVAFTVIVSLLGSLLMSITLVPLLASKMKFASIDGEGSDEYGWEKKLKEWFSKKWERFTRKKSDNSILIVNQEKLPASVKKKKFSDYIPSDILELFFFLPSLIRYFSQPHAWRKFLRKTTAWSIRNRVYVMLGVAASLVASLGIYQYGLAKEFVSSGNNDEFIIFVELPSGSKLEISDKIVSEVESTINALPEVKNVVRTVSSRVEGWSSKVYVSLKPESERTRTAQDLIQELRPKFKGVGGEYEAFIYFSEPSSSKELFIDLFGKDYNVLRDLAVEVAKRMQQVTGLRDVKLRYKPGQPEIRLRVDHSRASLFGLNSREIADTVHAQLRGLRATYFNSGNEQVETVARLTEEDRRTEENLKNLTFISNNKSRVIVPIQQVIDFENGYTPSEVFRRNKERVIEVSANRERLALSTAVDKVRAALKDLKVPIGYHYEFGGDYKKLVQSEKEFMYAFLIMGILVYMVLACFFESYGQPFLMLLTIPLALVGSMPMLWMTNTPVNMGVYIGLLMLGGTVTSNAVILIDRLNAVKKSRRLLRAVLMAGIERSRPIFMTSLSTIAAMLPLTFAKGESAEMWAPLAKTVVSGIALSSVLTLFVIPAAYVMLEVTTRNWGRLILGKVSFSALVSELKSPKTKINLGTGS
ncbi:MAG: efflux RND transporter permease subunit [Elusimicrobiota bacterium]